MTQFCLNAHKHPFWTCKIYFYWQVNLIYWYAGEMVIFKALSSLKMIFKTINSPDLWMSLTSVCLLQRFKKFEFFNQTILLYYRGKSMQVNGKIYGDSRVTFLGLLKSKFGSIFNCLSRVWHWQNQPPTQDQCYQWNHMSRGSYVYLLLAPISVPVVGVLPALTTVVHRPARWHATRI